MHPCSHYLQEWCHIKLPVTAYLTFSNSKAQSSPKCNFQSNMRPVRLNVFTSISPLMHTVSYTGTPNTNNPHGSPLISNTDLEPLSPSSYNSASGSQPRHAHLRTSNSYQDFYLRRGGCARLRGFVQFHASESIASRPG